MKIINRILICATALSVVFACKEDEYPDLKLNPAPTADFSTAVSTKNSNYIVVTDASSGHDALLWDFGNGATSIKKIDTAYYPYPGKYKIKLRAFSNGGKTDIEKEIEVKTTDPDLCNKADYTTLTGGCTKPEGKVWMVDATTPGHFGVGPADNQEPIWWQAKALEKEGLGAYDDEYTFKLNAASVTFKNNDDAFAHNEHLARFPEAKPQPGDVKVIYKAPADMTWSLSEKDKKKYLTITKEGFLGFWTGASTYEILEMTETTMHLRSIDGKVSDRAWYVRLKVKGSATPDPDPDPEPTPGKPLESNDISLDFETADQVTWNDQAEEFDPNFANPDADAVNGSAKVAKIVKGTGGNGTDHVAFDLAYRIDLSSRNVFKMKVYAPSANDYTTPGVKEDWAAYNTLQKLVSLKLQDSENDAPWETQAEVKPEITVLDEWVEYTFDFSAHSSKTIYDRILIQLGGEGNHTPGTFYFDDLELQ